MKHKVTSNGAGDRQSQWLKYTSESSESKWCIAVRIYPLIACKEDTTLTELKHKLQSLHGIFMKYGMVTSAVYSLLELLHSDDDEVLTNVCCALSYCIDGIHGIIQHHNHFSLIYDRLVGLLRHESCSVIIPVLKIVVGIVESDASWYCKFNPADLGCLVTLLDNHNEDGDVVNDICSIICGVVSCGNMEDVIAAGFMNKLVNLIQISRVKNIYDADVETVNIAIAIGNDALIKYLVDISCMEVLCDFIASCSSETFMKDSFESLEKLLEFGAPSIDYARQIEKKIESIRTCRWSWPRQVPFYFGEFSKKLDKYLGRSKRIDLKDMFTFCYPSKFKYHVEL